MNELATKAGLAVLGVALGWAGNALTLQGRVAAIEAGQARIEQQVTLLVAQLAGASK